MLFYIYWKTYNKMGLFKKKEAEKKEIPRFPELPRLPELPILGKGQIQGPPKSVSQLPSFPKNSIGEKFSQNTIKHAISGKKEGEEVFDADDFAEREYENMQMMPKPLKDFPFMEDKKIGEPIKIRAMPYKEESSLERSEPIFIRIDRFEESLNIFKKVQNQILRIEKDLSHLKKIKEEETKELDFWEKQIQEIKQQVEKIDSEIFSKVD